MNPPFRLMFPPAVWRQRIPDLVRQRCPGLSRLTRNDHVEARELIARDCQPAAPVVRGCEYGPLEDLLLLQVQPSVAPGDASALLDSFSPLRTQGVAVLVLGRGAASGQWVGCVGDRGSILPLDEFTLVGSRMRRVTVVPSGEEDLTGLDGDRWSRQRGALGHAAMRRVRESSVGLIGAGRNGSAAAQSLAMLGVRKLVLVDADRDELHNLDATVGATPDRLGRFKVVNRRETLKAIRPTGLEVQAIARPVLHPEAVQALRGVDLLMTCVDRDPPRLATAMLASRWCKVHLDVGTGVFREGGIREMGGDIRLMLPGEACVLCMGGLRNLEDARYEVSAPPGVLRRGRRQAWNEARAGSLLTVDQVAVNLGIQFWLDLLSGEVRESRWCHLEWRGDVPVSEVRGPLALSCDLCGRHPHNQDLRVTV